MRAGGKAGAALADENLDDERLARLLTAEAGLAVRVLTIASAARARPWRRGRASRRAPAARWTPTRRCSPGGEALLTAWHARIGLALALRWRLPEAVCTAIAEQDTLAATRGGRPSLNDVLAVAVIGSADDRDLGPVAAHLAQLGCFGLDAERWSDLLQRARLESAALRTACGE